MRHLSESMGYAYDFITLVDPFQAIKARHGAVERLARLTMDCAYFLRDYIGQSNFREFAWKISVSRHR